MKKKVPRRTTKPKLELKPIEEVARHIGIKKKFLENYGPYKAKISLDLARSLEKKKNGKYIVVTSITPPPLGEGKTITAIGLSMAFNKLRKKAISCIMQPSLGGIFGIKGTGSGGGLAQALPREDVNLHLTGDSHAVLSAHNLAASFLDNVIFKGSHQEMDLNSIAWPRTLGTNDRALRNVNIGLGSKNDGVSRKTCFDIAEASELMAILSVAENLKDMRERVGKVIIGYTKKGKPITCEELKVAGAMSVLLKDALKPNLLQTPEGTPCFVHTGAFGNTTLGSSSVIADKMALKLSDYVISEAGFSADTGGEKFFDIKCKTSGLKPDACVLVASVRGLKMHSGDFEITNGKYPREIVRENISAVERGFSNMEKQIENLQVFGVPLVVCINRFSEDSEKEIQAVIRRSHGLGVSAAVGSTVFSEGGQGGTELAKAITEACKTKPSFRFLYPVDLPIKDKIRRIAKTIYGAKEVVLSEEAGKKVSMFKKQKLDKLPVCIVKTHLSLSHSPKRKGRPHGFKLPIDDLRVFQGAGYIVAYSTNIKTMPGLPKIPRGTKIDINEDGKIVGLF